MYKMAFWIVGLLHIPKKYEGGKDLRSYCCIWRTYVMWWTNKMYVASEEKKLSSNWSNGVSW